MAKQGINQEHGHLYATAAITVATSVVDTYVAVTHATLIASGRKRHATLTATAGKVTVGPGRARVNYKLRTSTAAKIPKTKIMLNGTAQEAGYDVAPAGAALLSGVGIFDLTAETEIQVGLANGTDGVSLVVETLDLVVDMLESKEPRQPR